MNIDLVHIFAVFVTEQKIISVIFQVKMFLEFYCLKTNENV